MLNPIAGELSFMRIDCHGKCSIKNKYLRECMFCIIAILHHVSIPAIYFLAHIKTICKILLRNIAIPRRQNYTVKHVDVQSYQKKKH